MLWILHRYSFLNVVDQRHALEKRVTDIETAYPTSLCGISNTLRIKNKGIQICITDNIDNFKTYIFNVSIQKCSDKLIGRIHYTIF